MRYIKDIPNPRYKIGLYQWNSKYIIKIESGMYEQTYKIDDYEVASTDELEPCMDDAFTQAIADRYDPMHAELSGTLIRHNVLF